MGPKSEERGPYKKRGEHADSYREVHVQIQEEIGVILPQIKECLVVSELKETQSVSRNNQKLGERHGMVSSSEPPEGPNLLARGCWSLTS